MPLPTATRAEMRELDRRALEEFGLPGLILMENAGRGAAEQARALLTRRGLRRALVFAGRGNNGGDGYVVARHLANGGVETVVVRVADPGPFDETTDAGTNGAIWRRLGGVIHDYPAALDVPGVLALIDEHTLTLDGIFGTGLAGPLRAPVRELVTALAARRPPTLALDLPTGLDADTGAVLGACWPADLTATFGLAKPGFFAGRGPEFVGELHVVEISLPRALLAPYLDRGHGAVRQAAP